MMIQLSSIFDLEYGHSLELNALKQVPPPAGVNFVSRTMKNNGVTARVTPPKGVLLGEAGQITVALSGNSLSSFVQPEPFLTGYHVMILTPKNRLMSLEEKLWYCLCIWSNRHRYSYGRQANRTLSTLLVPKEAPSWVRKMSVPSHDGLRSSSLPKVELSQPSNWRSFMLNELFTIKKGKRVTKAARMPGNTRFIGASDRNNGITDMCSLEPIFEAGTLSIPYNGSVGYSFFQDEPYFASDDIQVLVPKEGITKWAMLFVSTIIRHEKNRFTYGYKWNMARMKKTTIRLPATLEGAPDWAYMERYMRGLPFSAALDGAG